MLGCTTQPIAEPYVTESHPDAKPTCTPWVCPVCREPLQQLDRQYQCVNGHSFDRAKEGYVNLLLPQQKHSADPGDDKAMLRSRREFLEQGYYRPLADKLAELICTLRTDTVTQPFRLLDSGCGEGWYSGIISDALANPSTAPVEHCASDIARDACRMAAKRYRQLDVAVASNAALPMPDARLDLLLRVFAPGSDAEILRLLKPCGHFVHVSPGARHLFSLRELVYQSPREHDDAALDIDGLEHLRRERVSFDLHIDHPGDCARLLVMTPYYWQASAEKQAAIAALDQFSTPAEFCIDLYRKPGV
jgi:23S rRNA (guanine745-N1)-methyltransferase